MATCVWNCDLKLLRILLTHSDFARQHVFLDCSVPALMDPALFETTVRNLEEADYKRQRNAILDDGHASASQNFVRSRGKKSKLNSVDRT